MMKDCYIRKNSEFQKVYSARHISRNYHFTLFTKKNKLDYPRVGFTVTKKIGNAVTRNLIKRRLKAIYRENLQCLKPGYDYVFVVKKEAVTIDYKTLKKSFLHVCKKQKKVQS